MVRNSESFRALVCGGDGTVGWVLREMDNAGLSQVRKTKFVIKINFYIIIICFIWRGNKMLCGEMKPIKGETGCEKDLYFSVQMGTYTNT